MKARLLAASTWLRRTIENCTDGSNVPIDQRETVRLKNIRTRQYRSRPPNSFYMHGDSKAIVLVYSDSFAEFEFDSIDKMEDEIDYLRSQGIREIDFKRGFIRLIGLSILVILILSIVALAGRSF